MDAIAGSIWVTADIQQEAGPQKTPQLQAFHDAFVRTRQIFPNPA
jgi:hypothetical protein